LEHRHHRLAWTGIIATVVLGIGLFVLNFPVFIDAYDQYGWQVKCGTGYISDLSQAAAAIGDTNYVDECQTALLLRRAWGFPLVVLGGMVLLATLVASATTSARETLVARHDTA
jgi:hypothetical protein